jgi:glycosyltransferase involved in cell wall biosynthesis
MIKLSIITINYNNAEGLRKTLASVASQTYAAIEHIIVDGGSTDGSLEVIREYADNECKVECVKFKGEENGEADTPASTPYTLHHTPSAHVVRWISEPDKGIYNAMNKGIEVALGKRVINDDHTSMPHRLIASSPHRLSDYIQILNSGDILAADDVTERMMAALAAQCAEIKGDSLKIKGEENSEAEINAYNLSSINYKLNTPIFYGNMIKEYPDGRRVVDRCQTKDYTPESFYYFYRGTLNHDCAYIRRDLFEKYGLYNEDMKICSDWEWYVRAIVLGGEKTVYTDINVTVFDMTGISESDGKNKDIILKERPEYLESILPASVLRDYDMFSLPIEQYRRLKKYHLWGVVYFVERVLFKFEKWFKRL